MDTVVAELAKAKSASAATAANAVRFLRVEAEEVDAATERCAVAAVPCFVLLKRGGQQVARVEGADAAGLTAAVEAACGKKAGGGTQAPAAPDAPAAASAQDPANAELRAQLAGRRVEALVQHNPVVLFMKGTPAEPRCGFSRRVVDAILKNAPSTAAAGAAAAAAASPASSSFPYSHFDVLSDEAVREAVKKFSDWPTIPQLYVSGEFVGGCDIVEEMAQAGELAALLKGAEAKGAAAPAAAAAAPANGNGNNPPSLTPELRAELETLLKSSPLLLFMKGTPQEPRCGFSRRVVDALAAAGAPAAKLRTFDILAPENQAVREGLKVFSDWPTYPQLYSRGELVGGCDIVEAMAQAGELKAVVEDALGR
jgi:Grx4 family monothiol glutaredoxin